MVVREDWGKVLRAAAAGDRDAAERAGALLLEWAEQKRRRCTICDADDACVSFVEHLTLDRLVRLAAVEPSRLDAYLGKAWRNHLINWARCEERRQSHELTWTEWAMPQEGSEEDEGIDERAGREPDPAEIVLLSAEVAALRTEVTRFTPLKQQIFALHFEEQLTQPEVARLLGMKVSQVCEHVYQIRRHLREWLERWNAS